MPRYAPVCFRRKKALFWAWLAVQISNPGLSDVLAQQLGFFCPLQRVSSIHEQKFRNRRSLHLPVQTTSNPTTITSARNKSSEYPVSSLKSLSRLISVISIQRKSWYVPGLKLVWLWHVLLGVQFGCLICQSQLLFQRMFDDLLSTSKLVTRHVHGGKMLRGMTPTEHVKPPRP